MQYDLRANLGENEGDPVDVEAAVSKKPLEQQMRDIFVSRVQNIYSTALTGDLETSGAIRHGAVLTANIEDPDEREKFVIPPPRAPGLMLGRPRPPPRAPAADQRVRVLVWAGKKASAAHDEARLRDAAQR